MSLTEEQRRQRRRERNRMAGDALSEQDPATDTESDVVAGTDSDQSARDAGFRNSLERNMGTEEYERVGARGHDDPDKGGRYSAREVISEFRNSDTDTDEVAAHFKKLQADGVQFNQRARDYLSNKHGFTFDGNGGGDGGDDGGGTDPGTNNPDPGGDQEPGDQTINPTPGGGGGTDPLPGTDNSQTQNINQDNDITNSINGNGNQVVNNQDNSISMSRGYSGNGSNSSWKDAWMKNYFD